MIKVIQSNFKPVFKIVQKLQADVNFIALQ